MARGKMLDLKYLCHNYLRGSHGWYAQNCSRRQTLNH